MKAATYHRYGPPSVVTIEDVPRPEPAADEILVEVAASSVSTADWRLRASAFPGILWLPGRMMTGLFRPKKPVLGVDFAGRVAAAGAAVTSFAPGDRVFGFAGSGAHAQFLAIKETGAVAQMAEGQGFEEAAALPFGALSALVFLRDVAELQPGERILIGGATGGVGVYAVQIAKAMGAEVTGLASAANLTLLAELGADHAVDYRSGDAGRHGPFDVIVDPAGHMSFAQARPMLIEEGRFVPLNFGARELWQALWVRLTGRRRILISVSGDTKEDLIHLRGLVESGAVRPVIDSTWPLDRIAEAHAKVETRHKTGAVVVSIPAPDDA